MEPKVETIAGYSLKVSALAAALKCAASDDVRYYLNGIFLDFPKGRIVATDGHRLFCGAIAPVNCAPVIVPRALVEAALKANRGLKKSLRESASLYVAVRKARTVATEKEPARDYLECELNHALAECKVARPAIDAKFPDYERVIPTTTTGTASTYNAQYLADAAEALALYSEAANPAPGFMIWSQNGPAEPDQKGGDGPGVFTRKGVPALVVIMPVRTDDPEADARDWYTKPASPAPAPQVEADADPLA